jgi:serine/threonine protein kinase
MYSLSHPYIIKLFNHFEDEANFYLILELAEGGSLFSFASKRRGLDEPTVAQYMREIALAVNYLHCKQPPIIHRDIKPENILLDDKLRAKLCDFGWSNFFNSEEIRQTLCGTPEYLAPEMIRKSGHDTRLDLWNLGVLLYELLAGSAPFKGRNKDELYAT